MLALWFSARIIKLNQDYLVKFDVEKVVISLIFLWSVLTVIFTNDHLPGSVSLEVELITKNSAAQVIIDMCMMHIQSQHRSMFWISCNTKYVKTLEIGMHWILGEKLDILHPTCPSSGCHSNQSTNLYEEIHPVSCFPYTQLQHMLKWLKLVDVDFWVKNTGF